MPCKQQYHAQPASIVANLQRTHCFQVTISYYSLPHFIHLWGKTDWHPHWKYQPMWLNWWYDSLLGGCTTFTFHQLLSELDCEILELRLVRLYPFAQRRTRGNAAVAAKIIPREHTIDDLDRIWKEMIEPLSGRIAESDHDNRKQHPSDPGMVVYQNDPDPEFYWMRFEDK